MSEMKDSSHVAPESIHIMGVPVRGARRWVKFHEWATNYQTDIDGWTLSYFVSDLGKWSGSIWKRGPRHDEWWALCGNSPKELNTYAAFRLAPRDYSFIDSRAANSTVEMLYGALNVQIRTAKAPKGELLSGSAEQVANILSLRGYRVALIYGTHDIPIPPTPTPGVPNEQYQ